MFYILYAGLSGKIRGPSDCVCGLSDHIGGPSGDVFGLSGVVPGRFERVC
jgi:hypothetical protein